MDAAAVLAKLTVVVPVGPGDAMSARLHAQLAVLPSQVRVVHAQTGAVPDAVPVTPAVAATVAGQGAGEVAHLAIDEAIRPSPRWQVIAAPAGRATQQNAGARDAEGVWLWFLHADCVLAAGTLPALARFIDQAGASDTAEAGYFDLRFLDDGPVWMRLNTLGTWLRSRWLGLPFGDQGLILPRAVFERLGGFDPGLDRGEDHDLVWRLRRAKVRLRPIGAWLFTSARKYAEQGWWSTTWWHLRETWRQARRFSQSESGR
ncbi:glycosyltransferase [Lysobacter sp. A286]